MRIKLGLKAWSTNIPLIGDAIKLHDQGDLDYVEVFAVPGSYESTWRPWADSRLPCIVHAPHSAAGLNFSIREREHANAQLAHESLLMADALKSNIVIFHSGTSGTLDETIRQMRLFRDPRMVIENKPYRGLDGSICVGSTSAEIDRVMRELDVRFCLDFGHAIAAANSQKEPWRLIIEQFLALGPAMFHLTDGEMASELDHHDRYGEGSFPLAEIVHLLPDNACVTDEAKRENPNSATEYINDRFFLDELDAHKQLTLKMHEACVADCHAVYNLSNDPIVRTASLSSNSIPIESHMLWFNRMIMNPDCIFLVFYEGETLAGQIRLAREGESMAEISISVDSRFRGKGQGLEMLSRALSFTREKWGIPRVQALVKVDNRNSSRFFAKAGFKLSHDATIKGNECHVYYYEFE